MDKTIWTIGHSSRTLEEFVALLHEFEIQTLADIRHFPGSRKYPHFGKDALAAELPTDNIGYVHLVDLGGRRKPNKDSHNDAWRLDAFKGYADYMETQAFKDAFEKLKTIAGKQRTAYMCSEAVWWSCHRSLVSDLLKSQGWTVLHIMGAGKEQEHPYTKPASIVGGKLSYAAPQGKLL